MTGYICSSRSGIITVLCDKLWNTVYLERKNKRTNQMVIDGFWNVQFKNNDNKEFSGTQRVNMIEKVFEKE